MNYKKFKKKLQLVSILLSFLLAFNPLIVPLAYAQAGGETETEESQEEIVEATEDDEGEEAEEEEEEIDDEETTDEEVQLMAAMVDGNSVENTEEDNKESEKNNEISEQEEEPTATVSAQTLSVLDNEGNEENEENDQENDDNDEEGVLIVNENDAEVDNEINADAVTGENQSTAENDDKTSEVTIDTGDADAFANVLNILNMNIVGSDFSVLFLDLVGNEDGDIDLNYLWNEINQSDHSAGLDINSKEDLASYIIANANQANLNNIVVVNAVSGSNQATADSGDVEINTGNATAVANVLNFVNININGSNFLLPVINILGDFNGDLILPSKEKFNSQNPVNDQQADQTFVNDNEADINNEISASSNTGNNQTENNNGDTVINTGDASSYVNSISYVNQNIFWSNWFSLLINNLGNWQGNIYGWSSPDAVETLAGILALLEHRPTTNNSSHGQNSSEFYNQNQANIDNQIIVNSDTGNNQASSENGNVTINTGHATSVANLIQFVNYNIWGGQWFFGLINILGNWNGNLIFAYPDLNVTISSLDEEVELGQTFEFTINYQNQGYETASQVYLDLNLPQGLNYLTDTSSFSAEINGQNCRWYFDQLLPGQQASFQVSVQVNDNFSFEDNSLLSKIISPVHAAEAWLEKEIKTHAVIWTPDLESNKNNNTDFTLTRVFFNLPTEEYGIEGLGQNEELAGADNRLPVLEISAKNNAHEYFYADDTVLFEITVKNVSDVVSYDTAVVHSLFNGVDEGLGVGEFYYGDLYPNQRVVLRFGMELSEELILNDGEYFTVSQAYGFAPNGIEVVSPEVETSFEVRLFRPFLGVRATSDEVERVLGEIDEPIDCPKTRPEIWPYIMLFIVSSLGIITKTKDLMRFRLIDDEK